MPNFAELSKLSEDEAREYLEAIRWPDGRPVCPHCGTVGNATKFAGKAHRPGVWKCKACRKQFTVTVNTIFERLHIGLRLWLMAFAIVCASRKGVSALQLQRQLGLGSYQSAWHMAHRIRHAMSQEPLKGMLAGRVEVDETYVGGKPRPGNNESRRTGRGTKKAAVVALVERDGRARAFPIERVNAATLKGAVRENVDRSKEFKGGHFTVNHGAGTIGGSRMANGGMPR